jgi:hypothetical protein
MDKNEQIIREQFEAIPADTTGLAAATRARMAARAATNSPAPRKRLLPAFAAACAIVLLAGTVYATVEMGVFDRFIASRQPGFADIVQPVLVYAEDRGIRIEVIAAAQFGDDAVIYLSMTDTTGEGRITPASNAWLSHEAMAAGDTGFEGFITTQSRMLGFNAETNTRYREVILSRTNLEEIRLVFDYVELSDGSYGIHGHWEISITIENDPADVYVWEGEAPVIPGGMVIHSMIVSPLGVRWQGEYAGLLQYAAAPIFIAIEADGRVIPVTSASMGFTPETGALQGFAHIEQPLQLHTVTAIHFNETRILLP